MCVAASDLMLCSLPFASELIPLLLQDVPQCTAAVAGLVASVTLFSVTAKAVLCLEVTALVEDTAGNKPGAANLVWLTHFFPGHFSSLW